MIIDKLLKEKLISPPKWLPDNIVYLTVMGSRAYGTNAPDADYDCYGIVIPPKNIVFPHTDGHIFLFDEPKNTFEQWEHKKIINPDTKIEWGFDIFNICKFFKLSLNCNPNIIDSLFTAPDCLLKCSEVGSMIRSNKELFLSKKSFHTFKGYLFSQINKSEYHKKTKEIEDVLQFEKEHGLDNNEFEVVKELYLNCRGTNSLMFTENHKNILTKLNNSFDELAKYYKLFNSAINSNTRAKNIKKFSWCPKFLSHALRLVYELEQILKEGSLDLRRNKEEILAVKKGLISFSQVQEKINAYDKVLDDLYQNSSLPHKPDYEKIKALLVNCLEHHYGSIANCVTFEGKEKQILRQIKEIVDSYKE